MCQLMFSTAREVAPARVHQPEDLYNVPRNLFIAARYLRRLLIESSGDLGAALNAYHAGPSGASHVHKESPYVARVCTHFASLKARRTYRELVAAS